jgi:hypothetical protein
MFGRSRKVRQSTSFLLFTSSSSRDAISVGQERVCIHWLAALRAHSLGYRQPACSNPHTGLVRDMPCCTRLHHGIVIFAAGPSRPLVKLTLQVPVGGVGAIAQGPPGQAATRSFLFLFFLHCSLHLTDSTLTAVRLLSPRRLIIISGS